MSKLNWNNAKYKKFTYDDKTSSERYFKILNYQKYDKCPLCSRNKKSSFTICFNCKQARS